MVARNTALRNLEWRRGGNVQNKVNRDRAITMKCRISSAGREGRRRRPWTDVISRIACPIRWREGRLNVAVASTNISSFWKKLKTWTVKTPCLARMPDPRKCIPECPETPVICTFPFGSGEGRTLAFAPSANGSSLPRLLLRCRDP